MAINYKEEEKKRLDEAIEAAENKLKDKEKRYDENIALMTGYIDEIKLQYENAVKKATDASQ